MSQSELTLTIENRDILGKTTARLEGDRMAAVYYGGKEATTPITISRSAFKKLFRKAGESTVVILEGNGKKLEALIHEVDVDPIKGEVRHADFYILEKGKKVSVKVPLQFEGEAPAIKLGGIVVKVLYEMEVEAEAKNLPHDLTINLEGLTTLQSQILVKDVVLPVGVVAIEDENEVIAAITVAKEEKEDAPIDLAAIEVEKKGKKEEAKPSAEIE